RIFITTTSDEQYFLNEKAVHNAENIFGTSIAESNKSITFAHDMTSHASRRTAHPGRSSSFYIIA
ncbi:hypothetical protein, partial [Bacteroides bouchesdurhonensis]|uniref:hypothetical protein n=1 Tax=Bacteroides bouchesdurhonensis TaxID=1841855 RepID=UPI0022DED6B0